MFRRVRLDPNELTPMHGPNPAKLQRITESLRCDGWRPGERRIVVEESRWGMIYRAWTGSHRIQAARDLGLPKILCLLISAKVA